MSTDINKNIKINLEIDQRNRVKEETKQLEALNKTIEDTARKYEKLRQQHRKSSDVKKQLDLYKQIAATQQAAVANEERYLQHILRVNNALKEQVRLSKQQANERFWAQDVWRGNIGQNIINRYGLRGRLSSAFTSAQERVKAAQAQQVASSESVIRGRMNIAALRTKRTAAQETLQELTRAKKRNPAKIDAANLAIEQLDEQIAAEEKAVQTAENVGEAAAKEAAGASKTAGRTGAALAFLNAAAATAKSIYKSFNLAFKSVAGISLSIRENFLDILNRVSEITSRSGMASYNIGTSLFSNADARNTQLKYGLTGRSAYAFDVTRNILNIRSDEDLLYMNKSQRSVFLAIMQKQERWYSELESSGVLRTIQEFQLDFEMFKNEMAVDVLKWFAANKETVAVVLKGTLTVLKGIMTLLAKVFTLFSIDYSGSSFGAGSTALSDAVSSASRGAVVNKHVNMTAHLNANGVLSSQELLEEYVGQTLEKVARDTAAAL